VLCLPVLAFLFSSRVLMDPDPERVRMEQRMRELEAAMERQHGLLRNSLMDFANVALSTR
jgi:hypothetical protein